MSSSKSIFVVTLLMASLLIACSDQKSDGSAAKKNAVPAKKLTAEENVARWKKEAEAGNAGAQQKLGNAYSDGKGVPKDAAQAVTWWRKAAEQGNATAQHKLGVSYMHGEGITPDLALGMEWIHKAAEQGHAEAQQELGQVYDDLYDYGLGEPKNHTEAAVWYRKAADQKLAYAEYRLGVFYLHGNGVPKDATQAATWYRKAAEQGYADAQIALAWLYKRGSGVPKDDGLAMSWWRKAAEQGNGDAQTAVGRLYYHGDGVPRDDIQAYMWLNLAASQQDFSVDSVAKILRDDLSVRMTSAQIAEAQRLSREWKPGQHTESATGSGSPSNEALEKALAGTAFFVSKQGHLLTNRHVVQDCRQVRLAGSDKPLKVLPQDEVNDLALLQMTDKPKAVAVFRTANDLRQGESIAAYGYPLQGALAAGGNLSPGVVSALAGLGNNTSQIQITAPVQTGNSGGPVLDSKGQVVGVVVQKLNAVKVAKLTGDVPQNVNFAINESTTRAFLDSNQVQYQTGSWWNFWQKDLSDIAEDARAYTVVVECWK